jgi:hypothetical protein
MNNKYIIGLVLVLVAFAAGYLFIASSPKPDTLRSSGGDLVYEEDKPYYKITAVYPGGVLRAKDAVEAVIAQFKEDTQVENLTPEDVEVQGLGGERKYTLDITYKKYESPSTYSYAFTIYQDTLGAHPNGFYATLTFDKSGNELMLEDLFQEGSGYLDQLSQLAYEGVVTELEAKTGAAPTEDMFDTARVGTAPSPEALQFFYIEGQTLHLLFPPYQVAAYAAGSFDIAIPLNELADILKPGVI